METYPDDNDEFEDELEEISSASEQEEASIQEEAEHERAKGKVVLPKKCFADRLQESFGSCGASD